jgi:hypothetical protein
LVVARSTPNPAVVTQITRIVSLVLEHGTRLAKIIALGSRRSACGRRARDALPADASGGGGCAAPTLPPPYVDGQARIIKRFGARGAQERIVGPRPYGKQNQALRSAKDRSFVPINCAGVEHSSSVERPANAVIGNAMTCIGGQLCWPTRNVLTLTAPLSVAGLRKADRRRCITRHGSVAVMKSSRAEFSTVAGRSQNRR